MRTARPVLGVALAAVVGAVGAATAQADSAALDPSFGSGGIVTTTFPGQSAVAFDVAVDDQDRIVVVGNTRVPMNPPQIALARYLPDGSPDPSFGGGTGRVVTSVGTASRADAVAIQPDGNIVIAGSVTLLGDPQAAVLRYLPSGTLDTAGFGSGSGMFVTGAYGAGLRAVALQADGKIVVGGQAHSPNGGFIVDRLTSAGAADNSFDGDGSALVYNDAATCGASSTSGVTDVAVQPDSSIVAAGLCGGIGGTTPRALGIARFRGGTTSDTGSLDTSFGSGGAASRVVEPGKPSFASGLARQADGKLVEAGSSGSGGVDLRPAVVRWNADGSPDTTFGSGGARVFDFAGVARSRAIGASLEPSGRILVGGEPNPDTGFGLARFEADGGADGSFAPGGQIFTGFADAAGPDGMTRQPDGKVIEAGFVEPGGIDHFALVRYLVPQPSPPPAGPATPATPTPPPGTTPILPAVQLGPASVISASFDGNRVHLTIGCGAASDCDGTVSLAAKAPRKAKARAAAAKHKRKPRRTRTVSLGNSAFSLPAGLRGKLTLRPSRAGAALLRQHRRVRATATLANAVTGERKTSSVAVISQRKKRKHRR
jgi:uncharacterized delta-60 repeat protein